MADGIFKLASAILASGNNVRPEAAIRIAVKFIELLEQIERLKHEAQASHNC